MFEYNGWAVIRSDAGSDEADDNLVRELRLVITDMAESIRESFHIGEPLNGFYSVTASGLRNHYRHEVFSLFWWIAERSRQSYGLLYVRHDDVEGDKDAFRVYRLSGGKVEEFDDPFLS